MIHVGVREENGVERWQLLGPKGWLYQTARSQLGQAAADTDPWLQRRVGEQPGTMEVEEHRSVAQPCYSEPVVRP